MDQEEIRIKLPKHLALWLKEFSKAIAMTPDQLLANVLSYYYEAWKIGSEGRVKLELESSEYTEQERLEDLLNEYVTTIKSKNVYILKRFVQWIKSKGYKVKDINDDRINEFLIEHSSEKELKASTKYLYRSIIKKFVRYIQSKLAGNEI